MQGPLTEGVTAGFGTASEREFRSGRTRIAIQLDDALDWDRRIFLQVARALATVPGALLHRMPPRLTVEITPYGHHGLRLAEADWQFEGAHATYRVTMFTGRDFVTPNFTGDRSSKRLGYRLEEALIHEFAHILDYAAYVGNWHECIETGSACRLSGSNWQQAIDESPCAVSEYALTNESEDFAESVLAWLAYYAARQGRLHPTVRAALKERLGKRFAALNRPMHDRYAFPAAEGRSSDGISSAAVSRPTPLCHSALCSPARIASNVSLTSAAVILATSRTSSAPMQCSARVQVKLSPFTTLVNRLRGRSRCIGTRATSTSGEIQPTHKHFRPTSDGQ